MSRPPLIVNFAPTGAIADNTKNPHVPLTQDRIVEDVATAAQLGASIAHLHVRNEDASPSCDPARFAKLVEGLRKQPDCCHLVLCASTSGRHGQSLEQRAAVLDLPVAVRPEMASLTLGSVNFPNGVSVNEPETVRYLACRMKQKGIKPELELFDVSMIEFAHVLISEGLLLPPFYFNLILGNISGLQATAEQLGVAMGCLPAQSIISVGGIGRSQRDANALGIAAADCVRVGLEDNLWASWEPIKKPATNSLLVNRTVRMARTLGRAIADPISVRKQLGLVPSLSGALR